MNFFSGIGLLVFYWFVLWGVLNESWGIGFGRCYCGCNIRSYRYVVFVIVFVCRGSYVSCFCLSVGSIVIVWVWVIIDIWYFGGSFLIRNYLVIYCLVSILILCIFFSYRYGLVFMMFGNDMILCGCFCWIGMWCVSCLLCWLYWCLLVWVWRGLVYLWLWCRYEWLWLIRIMMYGRWRVVLIEMRRFLWFRWVWRRRVLVEFGRWWFFLFGILMLLLLYILGLGWGDLVVGRRCLVVIIIVVWYVWVVLLGFLRRNIVVIVVVFGLWLRWWLMLYFRIWRRYCMCFFLLFYYVMLYGCWGYSLGFIWRRSSVEDVGEGSILLIIVVVVVVIVVFLLWWRGFLRIVLMVISYGGGDGCRRWWVKDREIFVWGCLFDFKVVWVGGWSYEGCLLLWV